MVVVAQLVRALDCGSRGRRFEPGLPPERTFKYIFGGFFCASLALRLIIKIFHEIYSQLASVTVKCQYILI